MGQGADVPGVGGFDPNGPQFQEGPNPSAGGGGGAVIPGAAPGGGGDGGGTLGALGRGFGFLSTVTKFLGDNKDEISKNAKALAALAKDIGSAHQTMLDSSLMRRMIQHGMNAPQAVFGGAAAQGAGRIQPTFQADAAASAGQWRGMR